MVISLLTLGRIDLEPWSTALLLVLVHGARASNWSVSGGSWWGITQQLSPWSYQRKLPRSLIYAMLPTLWTVRGHGGEGGCDADQ